MVNNDDGELTPSEHQLRPVESVDKHLLIQQLLAKRETWNSNRFGNRKVFCHGKIMIGPVRTMWWLLELLSIITMILFIWEYEKFYLAVTVVGAVLFSLLMISSWKTLISDPGVIKKPTFDEALENAREAVRMNSPGFPTKQFEIENRIVTYKYCPKCQHFRPPEARHCNVCSACVDKFDHHCPVFGGCIGKNNYHWFQLMVFSVIAYYLFLLISGSIVISERIKNGGESAESIFSACITLDLVIFGGVLGCCLCPFVSNFDNKPPTIRPSASNPRSIVGISTKNRIYPLPPYYNERCSVYNISQIHGSGDYLNPINSRSIYGPQRMSDTSINNNQFY